MNHKYCGDRICPECEVHSLFEHGLKKWRCDLCGTVFDEDWLDECEE